MVRYKSNIKAPFREVEEGSLEDLENVDTLLTELEVSRGRGNIIICVVNSPLYRDRIIQLLKDRFRIKVINVREGNEIIHILKEKNFGETDVLVWIMPEEPKDDIINALNNFRELFYDAGIPSVIFFNSAFTEKVIREAPDFWRYRGNFYEFKGEGELPFIAFEYLTTPLIYENKEELEKRREINEYLLDKTTDKKFKADILSDLGLICYYLGELDKALEYFTKALKLNTELERKGGIAQNYLNIGNVYSIKGELDKALDYYNKALKINEELGRKEEIAGCYVNIGNVYRIKDKLDKALDYYNKALKINEELGRKGLTATIYRNIGVIYGIKGELDKALNYFLKALKIDEKLRRKKGVAGSYLNIGNVYSIKGELDKALDYYNKALKINEELGRKEGIADSYLNIGNVYRIKGELDKALEYLNKALELNKELGNIEGMGITYRNIGNVYWVKGKLDKALEYLNKALKLFDKLGAQIELFKTLILIDNISEKMAKKKKHQVKQ